MTLSVLNKSVAKAGFDSRLKPATAEDRSLPTTFTQLVSTTRHQQLSNMWCFLFKVHMATRDLNTAGSFAGHP